MYSIPGEKDLSQDSQPSISTVMEEATPDYQPPISMETADENEDTGEVNEEINEVIQMLYADSHRTVCDVLEPAFVARTSQDIYEAIDYDMEIMGSDLCKYEKFRMK